MAEKPKRSCKICHRRKIRCDGETPCGSCSRARKLFVCEYPPELSLGTTRVYLPKNLACVPCRQRKRRCDGKSPCSTCKETSQSDKCHRRQAVRRERESGSSHKTLVTIASRPLDTAATNSGISSLVFVAPTCVPRHIVLDTALSSLRSLFLDYSLQFCGINLTLAQREAIACGDTSGAIVPSIFIPLSQLMGHLLADVFTSERWAHLRGQTEKEAEHRLHILDRLNNSTPDALDPLTAVQVYQILALYWAKRRDFPRFLEFLGSASSIVDRHRVTLGLDDPAASDGPATNSPEGQSALAYLIFTEVAANNSMPFPPIVPPVLLLKFHQLFDRPQNKLDLNFVRAKGVLLLAESQRLVTEWNRSDSGTSVGRQWTEQCRTLANAIQTHLHVLNLAIDKLSLAPKLHVLLLKSSTIVSLAALAALHAVLAPFHAVAREKHRNIINAIASITRTLTPEDHHSFDCTLEVCWGIASQEISEAAPTPQWRRYLENIRLPSALGEEAINRGTDDTLPFVL